MLGKGIFRKAALERLASPERLDELMRVTSPAGWIALGALGFAILSIVIWGIVGSISMKVHGRGILMRGGAVYAINALGSGQLLSIEVVPGQIVHTGDVVARLDQPALRVRIENTREELAALSGHGAQQRTAQRRLLARYRRRAEELRKKIETQRKLVERGLLTNTQLMQTQAALTATEESIASLRATTAGTSVRIEEVRARLRELETQLQISSVITSPYTGRVLEVVASPGDLVRAGDRIVTLEDASQPLKAVLFIPAADGKKVRVGMLAHIAPSTVRPEEYGYVLGEVRDVSEFPLTPDALVHILHNEALAQELTGKMTPIRVDVELEQDPEAPSGFRWTSGTGPPTRIYSGTVCRGSVLIGSKRPISYVIPLMKRAVGIS